MAYKILINSKGVPVLVTVPSMSEFIEWSGHESKDKFDKEAYEQALSTALADESKHMAFKDISAAFQLLDKELLYTPSSVCYNCLNGQHRLCNDLHNGSHSSTRCLCDHVNPPWWGFKSGQTFDLPDNVGVSFEERCQVCGVSSNEPCQTPSCDDKPYIKFPILDVKKPEPVPSCGDGWISVKDRLPERTESHSRDFTGGKIQDNEEVENHQVPQEGNGIFYRDLVTF